MDKNNNQSSQNNATDKKNLYFFIQKPRFAMVISIFITLVGIIAMMGLKLEKYPNITPPQIMVSASYPGASADVVESSVASLLESQINGVEDMLYMISTSSDESYQLQIYFKVGSDRNIDLVNVQNRIQQIQPKLPEDVKRLGVTAKQQVSGAGVAIVTPMKANGEINYDKLAELLDFQINNSTDAIVICGTTGESATMTEKEHVEAIRFTADYVKKRVPVVAGTGSNCTQTAVELSKEAQAAGVDACLVVTPYYNKASQKGLIEHYTTIAKSIDLPIIMYNVPSRTGCNILPETAVKLAKEVDNIVAIKAATGNLSQESKTMMLAEGCLDMYSGEDGLIVPLMSIGAKGVISVLSNVAPKQTHDICAEFFAGNVEKSRQLQFEALELVDALFCEVNPIPVKTALNLMGMEVGPLRMPLCEMEEANLNKLKTALKNYGLIK